MSHDWKRIRLTGPSHAICECTRCGRTAYTWERRLVDLLAQVHRHWACPGRLPSSKLTS